MVNEIGFYLVPPSVLISPSLKPRLQLYYPHAPSLQHLPPASHPPRLLPPIPPLPSVHHFRPASMSAMRGPPTPSPVAPVAMFPAVAGPIIFPARRILETIASSSSRACSFSIGVHDMSYSRR